MPKSPIPKPTDSELQILQILWKEGPCSVRRVNEQLNLRRETGYTTTLKLMQIMTEKGLVKRNTERRTHIYEAVYEKEVTQNSLLRSFLDRTFQGSAMNLVLQTLGNHTASKQELKEIKRFIEKLENKNQ